MSDFCRQVGPGANFWQSSNLFRTNKVSADFAAHLERIRKVGYEKRASYLVNGVTNISFPVFGEGSASVAAITIPYIQHSNAHIPEDGVVRALRYAASEISVSIGGRMPASSPEAHEKHLLLSLDAE